MSFRLSRDWGISPDSSRFVCLTTESFDGVAIPASMPFREM